jgi:hypothetical protein
MRWVDASAGAADVVYLQSFGDLAVDGLEHDTVGVQGLAARATCDDSAVPGP